MVTLEEVEQLSTDDILDTVLLNLRIEEGRFLADLGDRVVSMVNLLRDSKGNVWATYILDDEQVTVKKYDAERTLIRGRSF
jgi:hypothetical protein